MYSTTYTTHLINSKPSNILMKKGDTHTNKDTCNKDTKRKNKHKGTTY